MRNESICYPYDGKPKEKEEANESLTEEGLACRAPMRKPWESKGGRSPSTIPVDEQERY